MPKDLDSLEDLFTIIVMLFYRNSSLTGTNNSRQQPAKAYERLTRLMWRKLSRQDHYHVPDHRSWYDLFCTLNQLNKGLACVVREQCSFIPSFFEIKESAGVKFFPKRIGGAFFSSWR